VANWVHFIKQGDQRPSIIAVLGTQNSDGTVTPDNLTGCTVTLNARLGNTLVIAGASVTVTNAGAGAVRYDFGPNDTLTPGNYNAEFKSTDGSGKQERYPDNGNFIIQVFPQVGA
jgi:hypothetical protein